MQLVYPGPHPAVIVPGVGRVERGTPVDVPGRLEASLLAQGWHEPKPSKPAGAKPRKSTRKES
jgi:hypothetical protein